MALTLDTFTFGVGDRFAHQAKAQLQAFIQLKEAGVDVTPVWNKSNREHLIIGSEPDSVRAAAEAAVEALQWKGAFHVDADHIQMGTVDRFLKASDFYTIDVADAIGQPAPDDAIQAFVDRHPELVGEVTIPGIDTPFATDGIWLRDVTSQYLLAVQEARRIYRHLVDQLGDSGFATEVSMDETDQPQTPPELLVILAALADEGIPVQTIAPKFTGRFNKGVDYVGDLAQFEKEFSQDLAVIAHAVDTYGLPKSLKLSVHSGSDKFSLYPIIQRCLNAFGAGLHLKTAGTTWLEELIGLAESGEEGFALVREIYGQAFEKREALCEPYATVIDIDPTQLPSPEDIGSWKGSQFVNALRHDPTHPEYNPHLRQLLHVGFKVAASLGERYLQALRDHEAAVSQNVTANLFERHMKPLFLG